MAEYKNINAAGIAFAGFVSVTATFLTVVVLIVVYHKSENRLVQEIEIDQPWTEVNSLIAKQEVALTEYRWIDQAAGKASIPIELAIDLVVSEVASGTFDYPINQPPEESPADSDATTEDAVAEEE